MLKGFIKRVFILSLAILLCTINSYAQNDYEEQNEIVEWLNKAALSQDYNDYFKSQWVRENAETISVFGIVNSELFHNIDSDIECEKEFLELEKIELRGPRFETIRKYVVALNGYGTTTCGIESLSNDGAEMGSGFVFSNLDLAKEVFERLNMMLDKKPYTFNTVDNFEGRNSTELKDFIKFTATATSRTEVDAQRRVNFAGKVAASDTLTKMLYNFIGILQAEYLTQSAIDKLALVKDTARVSIIKSIQTIESAIDHTDNGEYLAKANFTIPVLEFQLTLESFFEAFEERQDVNDTSLYSNFRSSSTSEERVDKQIYDAFEIAKSQSEYYANPLLLLEID